MRTTYLNTLPDHWQPVAAVFAAMGDTTRQRILLLFEPGEELSIKDIVCHAIVLDSLEKLRLFIEEDLQEATALPQTAKGTNP